MTTTANVSTQMPDDGSVIRRYNAFLLTVAGLGGLLYGIDVGIIAGALPYLEATSQLTAAQLWKRSGYCQHPVRPECRNSFLIHWHR